MTSPIERAVRDFYDEYGWGQGGEDEMNRQFRPAYWPYHKLTDARTLGCFAGRNGRLLIAGGGDLPQSHVDLASHFNKVTCIDISRAGLDISQHKLPSAERVLGSICNAPLPANTFDAVFAAHVIYHIDANEQERAVRELIRVTKPGGRIVIIYFNPRSPIRFAARQIVRRLRNVEYRLRNVMHRLRRRCAPEQAVKTARAPLYSSPYPLSWWSRFKDACSISMLPWDIIGNYEETILIPSEGLARAFYAAAAWFERQLPSAAVHLWGYTIIILDRN